MSADSPAVPPARLLGNDTRKDVLEPRDLPGSARRNGIDAGDIPGSLHFARPDAGQLHLG